MSEDVYTGLWKAYRTGYIQAASEYGGPEYERTVAEAEAHACKYAEARATPTPARSEAAGGELDGRLLADRLDSLARSVRAQIAEGTLRFYQSDVDDLLAAAVELTSLRQQLADCELALKLSDQQLAAAREDGERIADLAAAAIYRLGEGAPFWLTQQAYGLSDRRSDVGEAFSALREALGITVGINPCDGYVFTRSDRARTEPAREGEGGNATESRAESASHAVATLVRLGYSVTLEDREGGDAQC